MASVSWILGVVYIGLLLTSLVVGVGLRCRVCWYYGRRCGNGLGVIAPYLFKQGPSNKFGTRAYLIPAAVFDFSVLLLPLAGCALLLASSLSPRNLALSLSYVVGGILPSFFVRSRLVCLHCKQGQIDCPAYKGMKGSGT